MSEQEKIVECLKLSVKALCNEADSLREKLKESKEEMLSMTLWNDRHKESADRIKAELKSSQEKCLALEVAVKNKDEVFRKISLFKNYVNETTRNLFISATNKGIDISPSPDLLAKHDEEIREGGYSHGLADGRAEAHNYEESK